MKILCDKALPNSVEIFSQYGEVITKGGREIVSDDLKDIDVLITRSITKVDQNLLKDATSLKFVGTATAGMDHFDIPYLESLGIPYHNAQGSNAKSVGDYVLSVLLSLANTYQFNFENKSIGIIGCGFVGSEVEKKAQALGLRIVKNDPPRFRAGDTTCNGTLDEALACDIVTLHVPLIKEGIDKTYHLIDESKLKLLKEDAILINASRGLVVDNEALSNYLDSHKDLKVWLDVFEGEPQITHHELLGKVCGATAHIAGYSYESKRRANVMLCQKMAQVLKLEKPNPYKMPTPELISIKLGNIQSLDLNLITRLVFSVYNVQTDAFIFAHQFNGAKSFDLMRANYRERHELSSLKLVNVPKEYQQTLSLLGFSVED